MPRPKKSDKKKHVGIRLYDWQQEKLRLVDNSAQTAIDALIDKIGDEMDLTTRDSSAALLFDGDRMKQLFNNCAALSKSFILKPDLRGKPEAILSIVLMAKELNIPPMIALTSMHFIQGCATLPASIMLALANTRVKDLEIKVEMDHKNKAVEVFGKRPGCSQYSSYWDMDRAKQMGLAGRDQYIKQPLTMLKWRAITDVLRVVCPEAIMGIYGFEEMIDFSGEEIEPIDNDIEQDFPIPEEETRVGNFYRIQNGKHRGLQLKDFSLEELEEYKSQLEKQIESKAKRPWHDDLHAVVSQYLLEFDEHRALLPEDEGETE